MTSLGLHPASVEVRWEGCKPPTITLATPFDIEQVRSIHACAVDQLMHKVVYKTSCGQQSCGQVKLWATFVGNKAVDNKVVNTVPALSRTKLESGVGGCLAIVESGMRLGLLEP